MRRFLNIVISILVLVLLVYILYFATDIGYQKYSISMNGGPLWLSSIITCISVPMFTLFCLEDNYAEKTQNKQNYVY